MRNRIERLLIPFVLLLICATLVLTAITAHRIAHDEGVACVIQKRGLPAERDVSIALIDLEHLLSKYSLSKSNLAKAKKELPPAVYTGQVALITDFTQKIADYERITAAQPQTRTCVF